MTCPQFGALVMIKCTWHYARRVNMSAVGNTGVAELGLISKSGKLDKKHSNTYCVCRNMP
jgi:hypothetical protein